MPSAGSALAPVANLRRRMSIRATGVRPRRSTSSVAASGGAGGVLGPPSVSAGGAAHIQLLSIPQLDAIQRTLRILDVRLQHVQSNGPARSQPAGKQLHGTVEVSRPSVHTHTHTHTQREREREQNVGFCPSLGLDGLVSVAVSLSRPHVWATSPSQTSGHTTVLGPKLCSRIRRFRSI